MELTERYPKIGLIIALFAMLLPFSATVQGQDNTTFIVQGFALNESNITDEIRTQLDAIVSGQNGLKAVCESGRKVKVNGYSDHHPYRGVSQEKSDRLNDILAWERLRKVVRFLSDEVGITESCFRHTDPVYADGDIRGVMFEVTDDRNMAVLARLNTAESLIDDINQKISALEEKNKEQDERLDKNEQQIENNKEKNVAQDGLIGTNSQQIDDHERRLNNLEKQSWNVSGHLGLNAEYFADQLTPTISAGIQIGSLELLGWYGYMPDIGTTDLDIGTVNLRRESYGGLATWYLYDTERLSIGPSIGWEHGEDAIDGRGSYVKVYESALLGASANIKLIGPLHLKASINYAPVIKSYTYDNQVFADESSPIRLSAGISVTF